jgi:hypothetical protein
MLIIITILNKQQQHEIRVTRNECVREQQMRYAVKGVKWLVVLSLSILYDHMVDRRRVMGVIMSSGQQRMAREGG